MNAVELGTAVGAAVGVAVCVTLVGLVAIGSVDMVRALKAAGLSGDFRVIAVESFDRTVRAVLARGGVEVER